MAPRSVRALTLNAIFSVGGLRAVEFAEVEGEMTERID